MKYIHYDQGYHRNGLRCGFGIYSWSSGARYEVKRLRIREILKTINLMDMENTFLMMRMNIFTKLHN